MANVLNAQVLVDGVHNYVLKYTGVLDTADLSAVTLVDVSGLNGAPSRVTIEKVEYSISDGLEVDLLWDATADVLCMALSGQGELCGESFGGFPNNAGSGVTGDILITTAGFATRDSFTLILHGRKSY